MIVHSNNPLLNESTICICDQFQVGPEGTSKLHEEAAKCPWFLFTYITIPSAAKHAPRASWSEPYDWLMEEESRPWFPDGSAHYPGTIQKWTAVALYPLSETTLKDTPVKKNLHSEQAELWAVPWGHNILF